MRTLRKTLTTSAAAAALTLVTLASGATAAPVRISTDPFTSASTGQHSTEVEPDSFGFGSTIVTAFQVGRIYDGGAGNGGWATSKNGGATWTHGVLPGITTAAGGSHDRISDTGVAYDAKHNTWLVISLALAGPPVIRGEAIVVNRSTDGGLTWQKHATIATASGHADFDKPWIVCDNGTSTSSHYGNCYAQWDDYGNGGLVEMSTSSDGGAHWGPTKRPSDDAAGLGGQPLVQPGGTVIVPFASAREDSIRSIRSTNGGGSWGASVPVDATGVKHHFVAGSMRSGPLPSAEMDGAGRVYVAWEDCRFRGASCPTSAPNDIVMARSSDGLIWSAVTRVPTTPVGSTQEAFVPGLGVDPATSGTGAHLALAYHYMPTTNCGFQSCHVHVGLIRSDNAGASWGSPVDISGPMTPAWLASTSDGYMTGDYISTSFVSGTPHAVFALAHCPRGGKLHEAIYQATPPAAGEKPPATCAPPPKGKRRLIALTLNPSKFHARRSGPSVAGTGGTAVSYQSSGVGETRFTVRRGVRRKGSVCGPPVNGHPRTCRVWVAVKGRFWHDDAKGTNGFHFTGHIGGAKLKPGEYRLLAEPRAGRKSAGNVVLARFTILAKGHAARRSYHQATTAPGPRTAR